MSCCVSKLNLCRLIQESYKSPTFDFGSTNISNDTFIYKIKVQGMKFIDFPCTVLSDNIVVIDEYELPVGNYEHEMLWINTNGTEVVFQGNLKITKVGGCCGSNRNNTIKVIQNETVVKINVSENTIVINNDGSPEWGSITGDIENQTDLTNLVKPTGIVEQGNTNAVSGGEVFKYINPLNETLFDINFLKLPNTALNQNSFSKTNGNVISDINYRGSQDSQRVSIEADKDYYYSGSIQNADYTAICFFTSTGVRIPSTQLSGIGTYDKVKIVIPSNAVLIAYSSLSSYNNYGIFITENINKFNKLSNDVNLITSDISDINTDLERLEGYYYKYNILINRPYTNWNQQGTLLKATGYATLDSNYRISQAVNMINIDTTLDYFYTGKIDNDNYCAIVYHDANGVRLPLSDGAIDSGFLGIGDYELKKLTIPPTAKKINSTLLFGQGDNVGIYTAKKESSLNLIIKEYDSFEQAKLDNAKNSIVSNFLTINNNLIGYDKRVNSRSVVQDILYEGALRHMFYSDITKQHFFINSSGLNLSVTKDFTTFENLYTFETPIGYVELLNDLTLIVSTTADEAKTIVGSIFKSDKTLKIFTKKIDLAGFNSQLVTPWGASVIENVCFYSVYDNEQTGLSRGTTRAYLSLDYGNTFTTVFDFHQSHFYTDIVAQYPSEAGKAHIHGGCYDPYENRIFITTGDSRFKYILYSEPITDINNIVWNALNVYNENMQMCDIYATKDALICGSDSVKNGMYILQRNYKKLEWVKKYHETENLITVVPGYTYKSNRGVIYSSINRFGGTYESSIIASYDGVNWTEVWRTDKTSTNAYTLVRLYESNYGYAIITDTTNSNRVMMASLPIVN